MHSLDVDESKLHRKPHCLPSLLSVLHSQYFLLGSVHRKQRREQVMKSMHSSDGHISQVGKSFCRLRYACSPNLCGIRMNFSN